MNHTNQNQNNIRTTNLNDLKIITWNARGLKPKQLDLQQFLYSHNIDIALIQETTLKPKDKIYIPKYKCIVKHETATQTTRRGVCIIIKYDLKYNIIPIPQDIQHLEIIGIKISTNQNQNLLVYSAYLRPQNKIKFPELDHFLQHQNNQTIIGGDFNSKHKNWNPYKENSNGKKLFKHSNSRDYIIIFPDESTHLPDNRSHAPSTLDFFLVKNMNLDYTIKSIPELNSDHNPVLLKFNIKYQIQQKLFFNYKNADWDIFQDELNRYTKSYEKIPLSKQSVEIEINNLTSAIQTAINNNIPKVKINIDSYQLTPRIIEMIKLRNKARKRWQQYRNPIFKNYQNKMSRKIQYEINILKNQHYEQKIKKLDIKDNTLWKNIKKFKKRCTNITNLTENGTNITEPKDIAETLAQNYENIHNSTKNIKDPETEEIVKKSLQELESQNNHTEEDFENLYTTSIEIKEIIHNLKNTKAPGEDKIQPIVLKKLPTKILEILTDIFNSSIKNRVYPDPWKNAIIIPILKKDKDKSLATSYRPISLLPTLGKVFERILLRRIQNTGIKLSQDEQFGYKKGLSTCHQLTRVVKDIAVGLTSKTPTTMILLDVEKAFDCVWHDGLIHKLKILGIDTILIKIIQSYLNNRTFQVSYNNHTSIKHHIEAGVPQGSVVGAHLFTTYLNDLPESSGIQTALYADDTALYIKGTNKFEGKKLQNHLNKLSTYYKKWKIKINAGKTEGITFSLKRNQKTLSNIRKPINFQGKEINWKKEVKYLGCYLDSKLTWRKHTDYIIKKTHAGIAQIYHLINEKSKLRTDLKILLYNMIIAPAITYAAPAWLSAPKTQKQRLQTIQNKYLRIVFNNKYKKHKIKDLHTKSNLNFINDKLEVINKNFYDKISLNGNKFMKDLINITPFNTGQHHRDKLPTIPKGIAVNNEETLLELQTRLLEP